MISIVIPTCNDYEKAAKNLLGDIIAYTDLDNVEIIVVANGSSPSIKDEIAKLGDKFRLIFEEDRVGVASAFNLGCKAAKGEFIFLINDDVRLLSQPKNQWLESFVSKFEYKKTGTVGKVIRDFITGQNFVVSFCMAIRAKVFEEIGYFDEAFNPYFGEDIDFGIRAQKAGWEVANVTAPMYHKSETESNPTAASSKIIAEKADILRKRYCDSFQKSTEWDLEQAKRHVSSPELAWFLSDTISKDDLVIDMGCGIGYYCDYLEKRGYTVLGVEGTKDIKDVSEFKGIVTWDLSTPIVLPGTPKNTTVLSFEVGEHIPAKHEDTFLDNITQRAKTVIMSWAVPGQGGDGHVNERPNDYIIGKMRDKGFVLSAVKTAKARKAVEKSPLWWFKNTLMVFNRMPEVTAYVSTKNRYFTTLPLCIIGIAMQTYKPKKLIIYDDGDHKDMREDSLYKNIFAMLECNGIQWEVRFTAGIGQIPNHQNALDTATTDWLWRIDDDNVPENLALEKMVSVIDDDIGAVGGLVLHPKMGNLSRLASSKIEDIYLGMNVQWYRFSGVKEVDHLYSTFIYRKEAGKHGYCLELSVAGHREETIFTYEMKRAGWRILVNPESITWHYRTSSGGTISIARPELFAHNENVFRRKLSEWGVKIREHKLIVLDSGLGDHLVFKKVLPEIKAKHKNILLAVCYPQVFDSDKDLTILSIGEAKQITNIDNQNVYKWMAERNWKEGLEEAYRRMFV